MVSQRSCVVMSGDGRAKDKAALAHVGHGEAVHERLLQPLHHLLVTPGNEDAIDVQGHDREGVVDPIRVNAQESDNVGVNPMPSSSPSMVSYQRPAPELLQAVQAALQLHHQA